jgi:hypothetical protein
LPVYLSFSRSEKISETPAYLWPFKVFSLTLSLTHSSLKTCAGKEARERRRARLAVENERLMHVRAAHYARVTRRRDARMRREQVRLTAFPFCCMLPSNPLIREDMSPFFFFFFFSPSTTSEIASAYIIHPY